MLFSSSKKTRRVTVCRLRRLEDIRDTRSTPAALYHCRGFCKNSCVMQVNCVKDGAYRLVRKANEDLKGGGVIRSDLAVEFYAETATRRHPNHYLLRGRVDLPEP
ncbi:hypothetical protein NC653_041109 [Populus alba x Populus x berolinensis]|uniref:Uncharacterized protein n=1 Tax=Populus alba x Populus x berolinensis TaxID=444605 RepID=A0AAD6L966_9ROSI|nr:hypothetical protein NC653_041109 [Populus alba x Populus x berolinensis]